MRKLCVLVALCATALPAWAGLQAGLDVMISPGYKTASGTVGHTRRSADAVQYIYCASLAASNGTAGGLCSAKDKTGAIATCTTFTPAQIAVIQSVNDSSHIYFAWNDSGQCTYVYVFNGSPYVE